jgi:hypothetical protein
MTLYYLDVDDTLCHTPKAADGTAMYSMAEPRYEQIAKMNQRYDAGDTIVIWTARGSAMPDAYNPEVYARCNRLHKLTVQQLANWGVKYHHFLMGKPIFDVLVDDRTVRIEELT